jgi:hypothetical protein
MEWGTERVRHSNIIALKDCKTSCTQTFAAGVIMPPGLGSGGSDVLIDWNKVIWNSARFVFGPEISGTVLHTNSLIVDCRGVCETDTSGPNVRQVEQIILAVLTSQERFEKALSVLVSRCPGLAQDFD